MQDSGETDDGFIFVSFTLFTVELTPRCPAHCGLSLCESVHFSQYSTFETDMYEYEHNVNLFNRLIHHVGSTEQWQLTKIS